MSSLSSSVELNWKVTESLDILELLAGAVRVGWVGILLATTNSCWADWLRLPTVSLEYQ